ncbi:hypothetical protein KFL_004320090 [Klebsormidium nitens]|uniref:Uncharacterized protein n=1 Tax=Klebsormidium nitens TaxID=105231 RepID=A0A1Y1ID10_KLENI|nr:hypothetical protein KFL_004320090 [Klebsormidium nitens]|eukprot:GAQ88483.1 hypothetical protein KFL_004320090 [Klebsormidium nitens]
MALLWRPAGSLVKVQAVLFGVVVYLLQGGPVRADNGTTISINFLSANGPVAVGDLLQLTTLLRNTGPGSYASSVAAVTYNGTLTVTCSDAYIININSTLASPGCTKQPMSPPYPVGLNGTYPGCDVNPQGVFNLNTSTGPVRYPSSVTADGHTAIWTNVILVPNVSTALPMFGRIQYQQPILCLATFGPSRGSVANSSILNALNEVNGTSSSTLQKGITFAQILQPPNLFPSSNPPPLPFEPPTIEPPYSDSLQKIAQ